MKLSADLRMHKVQLTDYEVDIIKKALHAYVRTIEDNRMTKTCAEYYEVCKYLRDAMFTIDTD